MQLFNRYGFGIARVTAPVVVLATCAVMVICGPQSAFAAERTVLCEEFTSLW